MQCNFLVIKDLREGNLSGGGWYQGREDCNGGDWNELARGVLGEHSTGGNQWPWIWQIFSVILAAGSL